MADKVKLLELGGKVIDVLKQIYDPEIPVNIYDLGLIYSINILSSIICMQKESIIKSQKIGKSVRLILIINKRLSKAQVKDRVGSYSK